MMDNEVENEYLEINDIYTVTAMNAVNINVNPETGEEYHDGAHVQGNMPTHSYNLHPRPIKPWQKFNLLHASQQ